MHNLISHNELASWKWDEKSNSDEKYDQVSEYFQCISECGIMIATQGGSADTS